MTQTLPHTFLVMQGGQGQRRPPPSPHLYEDFAAFSAEVTASLNWASASSSPLTTAAISLTVPETWIMLFVLPSATPALFVYVRARTAMLFTPFRFVLCVSYAKPLP